MDRPVTLISNQITNERVLVNHLLFPSGGHTEWHCHSYDYVIVPMQDAQLIMESEEGRKEVTLKAGVSYYRKAGVKHNVINPNEFDVTLMEIEII